MSIKFDIKNIVICVLGALLIFVIIYGNVFNQPNIDEYNRQIDNLTKNNKDLTHKNDSISSVNNKLDKEIQTIHKQVEELQEKRDKTQLEIDKLKKRNNEIHINVGHLSANDVADNFTKYLQTR